MDGFIELLREKSQSIPNNRLISRALEISQLLKNSETQSSSESYDAFWSILGQLREDGILGITSNEAQIIQEVEKELRSRTFTKEKTNLLPRISFEHRPVQHRNIIDNSVLNGLELPAEIVEQLNEASFLHILANEPHKVLPPGKSLSSALTQSSTKEDNIEGTHHPPGLKDKIGELVHKAFWDEAFEALSDPSPAKQIGRITRLYSDLYDAAKPLLPTSLPILVTLASPLSPTSAPLVSVQRHLRELVSALKARCAPVRDAMFDTLLDTLNASDSSTSLARVIVDTVRTSMQLIEMMKSDLSHFVFNQLSEEELALEIKSQAQSRERQVVLRLFAVDKLQDLWDKWRDQSSSPSGSWVQRTTQALSSNSPVSCRLTSSGTELPPAPSSVPNELPPPFIFVSLTLLRLQNTIQALVIVAVLLTLIPARKHAHKRGLSSELEDESITEGLFSRRVWSLLSTEITADEGSGDIKLINLADEVVREYQLATESSPDSSGANVSEEGRIRSAVDRMLKPQDPVYRLLHARLIASISPFVESLLDSKDESIGHLPLEMRTGLSKHERKRPRVFPGPNVGIGSGITEHRGVKVKGFEDPFLSTTVDTVLYDVFVTLRWIREVWSDVLKL